MTADATAQFVAMHMAIGQSARPRATPRAKPPTLVEVDYAARLVELIGELRKELQPLFDELPSLLASSRLDDASDGRRVRALVDRGRYTVLRHADFAPSVVQQYAERAAAHHAREFSRQTKAALGVELPVLDRKLPARIGNLVNESVSKVRSIEERLLGDVERTVARAITAGQPVEEVTAELSKRFEAAERGARRLASDQVTRLTADVQRDRHQEVGVTMFRWVTKADDKVRPSHAVKHNKVFPYEGSRAPSFFPGQEYNCRCESIPVLEGIKARAAALAGKGRDRSGKSSATFVDGIPRNRKFKDGKETLVDANKLLVIGPDMGDVDWDKDPVANEKARQAILEGQREPIKVGVGADGRLNIINGRHRLRAAAELGVKIRVQWYG